MANRSIRDQMQTGGPPGLMRRPIMPPQGPQVGTFAAPATPMPRPAPVLAPTPVSRPSPGTFGPTTGAAVLARPEVATPRPMMSVPRSPMPMPGATGPGTAAPGAPPMMNGGGDEPRPQLRR